MHFHSCRAMVAVCTQRCRQVQLSHRAHSRTVLPRYGDCGACMHTLPAHISCCDMQYPLISGERWCSIGNQHWQILYHTDHYKNNVFQQQNGGMLCDEVLKICVCPCDMSFIEGQGWWRCCSFHFDTSGYDLLYTQQQSSSM